jgi:hypothetical protein
LSSTEPTTNRQQLTLRCYRGSIYQKLRS